MTLGTINRKMEGRYGNMVRLNILIPDAQDRELDRAGAILSLDKSKTVRDAIQFYLGHLANTKVI